MFLLLLIPLVIVLIINYIVACKFEEIAFQKGYDKSIHSLAMCFWLGIVGYLYVIALPNLKVGYSVNAAHNEGASTTSSDKSNLNTERSPKEEQYDKLIAKAEKFKDTFYDRAFRIRVYEDVVREMEVFASEDFEDSTVKLREYSSHLELLKSKQIR